MESISENQDKSVFELEWDEAYAGTHSDVWEAIRFFNELKAVSLKELDSEDRTCSICMQQYEDPEDGKIHVPVRLPCSHVFGKECLARWTTPFGAWEENSSRTWEEGQNWFSMPFIQFSRAVDCPMCRGRLYQKPRFVESEMGLKARLMLWDCAYEKVGCLRCEKEEKSRADLVKYVQFHRIANGQTTEEEKTAIDQRWMELQKYHVSALDRLFVFAIRRKTEGTLSPTQARLQRNLEHISKMGLDVILDDPSFVPYKEGDYNGSNSTLDHNSIDIENDDNEPLESFRRDLRTLDGDLQELNGDLQELNGDLQELNGNLQALDGNLRGLLEALTELADSRNAFLASFDGTSNDSSDETRDDLSDGTIDELFDYIFG